MKLLIFQLFIGNLTEGYSKCIDSVISYAKGKADYALSNIPKLNMGSVYFEKFQFLDALSSYDRVLYVDSDILITPKAENIFDVYTDPTKFYAYDENDTTAWMDRDPYVLDINPKLNWPKNLKGKLQYFNTGVMLLSRKSLDIGNPFAFRWDCSGKLINTFAEQTYLNYAVVKSGLPFETISHSFNRMDLGNFDPMCERYKANFIHYAGPCKYGDGNKNNAMVSDYKALYGN